MSFTIDKGSDIPIYSPQCQLCTRYLPEKGDGRSCRAFPGGIPLPIWKAEVIHDRPYAGDHDLQFEPVPGASLADVRPS